MAPVSGGKTGIKEQHSIKLIQKCLSPSSYFLLLIQDIHGLNHGIKEDPMLKLIQKCMLPVSWFCFINFINISCYKVIEGIFLLTVPRALVLLWIIFVNCVSCLSCFHVCSLLPCGHLLGKG